jgi:hypothetical protein
VPPWAAAFGWSMFLATMSDCARHRFAFIIVSICISVSGFAMLLAIQNNTTLQYGKFARGCKAYLQIKMMAIPDSARETDNIIHPIVSDRILTIQ